MLPSPSAKLFSYVCAGAIAFFLIAVLRSSRPTELSLDQNLYQLQETVHHAVRKPKDEENLAFEDLKYILQWTPGNHSPFDFMGKGRSAFVNNDCEFTNCYVTDDRQYFLDLKDFDAVAFNGREVFGKRPNEMPLKRGSHQKYIFANMESAHYYPACKPYFDSYFNWTWTYRLDSDVRWGYVTAYSLAGDVVAPKANVEWPNSYPPLTDDIKTVLTTKTKPVAWFVSNCNSRSKREVFVQELKNELSRYSMTVDVYGGCGNMRCPRSKTKECNEMLARDYYFYLSFENSFAEDYVTEKLHTALENFAVPIVYGGANYSRFLPPGSYLNARELGAKKLAKTIHEILQDKSRNKYHNFHRWRHNFYYEVTSESADVCNLCALLNNEVKFKAPSVYKDFRKWWNPSEIDHLC